jgi:hypothetical protein
MLKYTTMKNYIKKLFARLLIVLVYIIWGIILITFIIPLIVYIITGFNWGNGGMRCIGKLEEKIL